MKTKEENLQENWHTIEETVIRVGKVLKSIKKAGKRDRWFDEECKKTIENRDKAEWRLMPSFCLLCIRTAWKMRKCIKDASN